MGVLERIPEGSSTSSGNIRHLVFKEIQPDSASVGYCYVKDGDARRTKVDKPFIRLFLQDRTGAVIPGYIFDVDNFKSAGLELTKVINNVVKITYQENFLRHVGLTLIVTKLELVVNPTQQVLETYVGTAKEARGKYQQLVDEMSNVLNMKVAIPFDVCTSSYMDYSQGKIGGLAIHYWDMFRSLGAYADKFGEQERRMLWGTFVLYIFTHSNYLKAKAGGRDDILLVSQLTTHLQLYREKLPVSDGVIELVHMFFGYQPKDIFVRLVMQVSDGLIRAGKEINLYQTLPITREGDAGYGTIRRYSE